MSASGHPPAPPPAGGFGAAPGGAPGPGFGLHPAPPPRSGGGATAAIIALVVVGALVVILGILAVLAIYGVRKYIANAKMAEAKSSLGVIARDAAAAYETDQAASQLGMSDEARLCPTSSAVPAMLESVRGRKYMSAPSDWQDDPGWKCLRFEMTMPQYYQYRYENTGSGFFAVARGDLNGDGVPSRFEVRGDIRGGRVVVSPTILETDPLE